MFTALFRANGHHDRQMLLPESTADYQDLSRPGCYPFAYPSVKDNCFELVSAQGEPPAVFQIVERNVRGRTLAARRQGYPSDCPDYFELIAAWDNKNTRLPLDDELVTWLFTLIRPPTELLA